MKPAKLSGVIPPLATPLRLDGDVDRARLTALAQYLLRSGVDGLFANGSMGGFPFLPDYEQDAAISTVVEAAMGQVPVMAGIGELATRRAVIRARQVAGLGVTHLSLLAPLFYFTTQEQLVRHFSEVAMAVDVPLVIYDNPVLTQNPIHPETVMELRERVPNIVAIKESNQDCINLQRLLRLTRSVPDFSVLTGSEHLILVALRMGVDGTVGGLHNLHPAAAVELVKAFRRGDYAAAQREQDALVDLADIFAVAGIWDSFQDAMRYLGLAERIAGEPYLGTITEEQSLRVRAIMQRHVKAVHDSLPAITNEGRTSSLQSGPTEA